MANIPPLIPPPTIERFLEHCHRRQYPAKSLIIYAGDKPDVLYYIVEGSVTVLIEDENGREIVLAVPNFAEKHFFFAGFWWGCWCRLFFFT